MFVFMHYFANDNAASLIAYGFVEQVSLWFIVSRILKILLILVIGGGIAFIISKTTCGKRVANLLNNIPMIFECNGCCCFKFGIVDGNSTNVPYKFKEGWEKADKKEAGDEIIIQDKKYGLCEFGALWKELDEKASASENGPLSEPCNFPIFFHLLLLVLEMQ